MRGSSPGRGRLHADRADRGRHDHRHADDSVTSFVVFRDRGNDAAAKAATRLIEPSVESYVGDRDTYAVMTVAGLKSTYDSGTVTPLYRLSDLSTTG